VDQPSAKRLRIHDELFANLKRLFNDIRQARTNRSSPEKIQGLVDEYAETEAEFHSNIDQVLGNTSGDRLREL
jgi:hypothetical protein